ncbi:MAG: ferredoxin [Candidatus Aenigmarchaeota archaeon]|nr:ferredoxin [Candidatus Aenigmarchaeota archaeon]
MPFKVIHERWKCIGCNACVAVSPEYWEMNEDGKSDIKGAVHKNVPEGVLEELEVAEPGTNKEAEESCPVSCIHVKKTEKN